MLLKNGHVTDRGEGVHHVPCGIFRSFLANLLIHTLPLRDPKAAESLTIYEYYGVYLQIGSVDRRVALC